MFLHITLLLIISLQITNSIAQNRSFSTLIREKYNVAGATTTLDQNLLLHIDPSEVYPPYNLALGEYLSSSQGTKYDVLENYHNNFPNASVNWIMFKNPELSSGSSYLSRNTNPGFYDYSRGMTIVVFARYDGFPTSNHGPILYAELRSGSTTKATIFLGKNTQSDTIVAKFPSGQTVSTGSFGMGTANIIATRYNVSGRINVFKNGALLSNIAANAPTTGVSSCILQLGYGTFLENFNGYMGDVLLWNRALSDTELELVNQYLENKYYRCGPGRYGTFANGTCRSCPAETYLPSTATYRDSVTVASCKSCLNNFTTVGETGRDVCYCIDNQVNVDGVCVLCPAGSYKVTQPGSQTCVKCPVGTYSSQPGMNDSSTCVECSKGQYSNITGASFCENCPAGSISTETRSTYCLSCQPGYFQSSPGQSSCSPCSGGTYSNTPNATICPNICAAGTFAPPGSTFCTSCRQGTVSNSRATECSPCPPGTFQMGSNFATCQPCPMGTYQPLEGQASSSKCQLCPVGTSSLGSQAFCTECKPGYYASSIGSITCTPCTIGRYQPLSAQTSCNTPCPVNTYTDQQGSANCTACVPFSSTQAITGASSVGQCRCLPGYGGSGITICTPCQVDFYKPTSENSPCQPCPPGATTNTQTASSQCSCPPNYFGNPSVGCSPCPVDTERVGFASDITTVNDCTLIPSCKEGYFGDPILNCTACPKNTFKKSKSISITYLTDCIDCGLGYATILPGAGGCVCAVGYQRNRNGECVPCESGQFKPVEGNNVCGECAENHWSHEGASRCLECGNGFGAIPGSVDCSCQPGLFLSNDATECLPCPENTYKPTLGNATTCIPCGEGSVSSIDKTHCVCDKGRYKLGMECVRCRPGSFKVAFGNDSGCVSCAVGMDSEDGATGCFEVVVTMTEVFDTTSSLSVETTSSGEEVEPTTTATSSSTTTPDLTTSESSQPTSSTTQSSQPITISIATTTPPRRTTITLTRASTSTPTTLQAEPTPTLPIENATPLDPPSTKLGLIIGAIAGTISLTLLLAGYIIHTRYLRTKHQTQGIQSNLGLYNSSNQLLQVNRTSTQILDIRQTRGLFGEAEGFERNSGDPGVKVSETTLIQPSSATRGFETTNVDD